MKKFSDYSLEKEVNEAISYHLDNDIPLLENIFRVGSEAYFKVFNEVRKMDIVLSEEDVRTLATDIGHYADYEGQKVPLDCPIEEEDEKNPPLNKPKRGGPKKFYVFVKDGDKIKKVTWGDTTGLKVKLDDPAARKSFPARHKCDTQKDKTKPAYWACNLPRYAKSLGLGSGGNFFW